MKTARWLSPVMLALALLATAPARAAAQRLGAVSSAVHGGGGGGGFHASGGGGGYRGSSYGYGARSYGYGGVQASAPWVPLYFPYYMGYAGVGVRRTAMQPDRTFDGPMVLGIVDASAGYVFDGVVRGQLSGRLRLMNTVDFEGRYGAYFEQTRDAIRELGLGRLAVLFALVDEDVVQLRGGIAGQLYHDAVGIELGYEGVLELDAYPVEPLVLHAELGVGALGQAGMVEGRATVGMQIDRGEIYLGYQVFGVDPFATSAAVLHGPIAGVRVWIS